MHCYRLKVRQELMYATAIHKLGGRVYFPFDNVYFFEKADRDRAEALFRYCFVLDVDKTLLNLVRCVRVDQTKEIPLQRSDKDSKKQIRPYTGGALSLQQDLVDKLSVGEWVMIVPTYARQKQSTGAYKLAYSVTRSLCSLHNTGVKLPTVQLKTPKGTIPALCAVCKHVASYYANKCSPGQSECRSNISIKEEWLEPEVDILDTVEEYKEAAWDPDTL